MTASTGSPMQNEAVVTIYEKSRPGRRACS